MSTHVPHVLGTIYRATRTTWRARATIRQTRAMLSVPIHVVHAVNSTSIGALAKITEFNSCM